MTERTPSLRRLDVHYMVIQAGFWAMFGAICAYQAALLLSRGFTNSDVGLIIAVRCLSGIIAQPALGIFADRHPNIPLKHIVAISLFLSFLVGLPLIFIPMGLGGTLVIFAFVGAFELSAYPLMDSMAIQFINDGVPIRYSLGRGVGSMAYALCCAALGGLTARFGIELILWVHAALVLVEAALVWAYPTHHPSAEIDRAAAPLLPQSPLSLLKSHPRFSMTLLAAFFGILGVLPLSNFLINIVQAQGGTNLHLGLGLFLMGAFELPTAILFPRLLRKFGSSGLMSMSIAFCALKGLAILVAPSVGLLLLAQPLQMMGYGLFTPTAVFFVNENVPAADRVQGQTLMMVASNGLGGVVGSFVMGLALDFGGVRTMVTLCLISSLIGLAIGLLAQRLPQRRPLSAS